MAYYHVCPMCGSHLDPNEVCECKKMPPVEVATQQTARDGTMTSHVEAIVHDEQESVNGFLC